MGGLAQPEWSPCSQQAVDYFTCFTNYSQWFFCSVRNIYVIQQIRANWTAYRSNRRDFGPQLHWQGVRGPLADHSLLLGPVSGSQSPSARPSTIEHATPLISRLCSHCACGYIPYCGFSWKLRGDSVNSEGHVALLVHGFVWTVPFLFFALLEVQQEQIEGFGMSDILRRKLCSQSRKIQTVTEMTDNAQTKARGS